MNNLLKSVKKLIREVNDDLVGMAENNGFTGNREYDEGYAAGLREYHLNLIELVRGYEE